MLSTLSSQLHFVREIQGVDTSNIEPLQSLRDESEIGRTEATIGLDELKQAFDKEDIKGQYYTRIRRRQDDKEAAEQMCDEWDALGHAERKVGKYFVVEGGKDG